MYRSGHAQPHSREPLDNRLLIHMCTVPEVERHGARGTVGASTSGIQTWTSLEFIPYQ